MDWIPRYYYILEHNVTGLMYIGQRVKNDVCRAYWGSGVHWKQHRRKHGWKDVSIKEIVFMRTEDDASRWLSLKETEHGEYWTSDFFANLIPESTDSKSFQHGFKHSDLTKQKMSATRKGRAQSGGVKNHTVESRQKMSERRSGRSLSDEDKLKKSLAQKGTPKTEEHKIAMRKPKRKINCPNCNRILGSSGLVSHLKACTKND